MIKNCQKSIFNFSHILKKIKIEFEITKNWIELFEIIKNWIENYQKISFQLFLLSEKVKIELKIAQNQFSFFWNYWKLNKNEMDVSVHECKMNVEWHFQCTDLLKQIKINFMIIFTSMVYNYGLHK